MRLVLLKLRCDFNLDDEQSDEQVQMANQEMMKIFGNERFNSPAMIKFLISTTGINIEEGFFDLLKLHSISSNENERFSRETIVNFILVIFKAKKIRGIHFKETSYFLLLFN